MGVKMKYACIVVFFSIISIIYSDENVIIKTNSGNIEGIVVTLENGFKVDTFLGIQYGVIPERFSKPLPVSQWNDVKQAKGKPPRCIQSFIFGTTPTFPTDTEDCLFLSLYAPHEKTTNGYPVMIFIHGGGFAEGSTREWGTEGITNWIVSKEVIFIDFHYRLGPWGFFTTGTDDAKGNWGLWDQNLLLKWVQENVAHFGGNPKKVTLFGESAGSMSTSFQSVTPHSRDLFQNAILMSASGLSPWFTGDDTINVSLYYAEIVGCSNTDMKKIVSCMRSKSTSELQEGFKQLKGGGAAFRGFTPRIDNDFFPKSVEKLILDSPPKPIIIGVTKEEMGAFVTPISSDIDTVWTIREPLKFTIEQLRTFMREIFVDLKYPDPDLLTELASFHYIDNFGSRHNGTLLTKAFTEFMSDFFFFSTSMKEAKLRLGSGSKVWLYRFDYFNPKQATGSYHYYDLWYLLKVVLHRTPDYSQEELQVVEFYSTLFTNFAKFGNPTEKLVDGIQWPHITEELPEQFLKIDKNLEVKPFWKRSAIAFWDELLPELRTKSLKRCQQQTMDKESYFKEEL